MNFKNTILYCLLYLMPKNLISVLMGKLVSVKLPKSCAIALNRWFANRFRLDLDEAQFPLEHYQTLQDLFIRRLKENLRQKSERDDVLVSPCDGTLSQNAIINEGTLIQAKGKYYGVRELVGDMVAHQFLGGRYATIYLSPRDYHRFHVPVDGEIIKTIYLPGTLWPVNTWAVTHVTQLFCQNERVVTIIRERQTQLLLAHIAVGATMVGKIELDYGDFIHKKTPFRSKKVFPHQIPVQKGDDLGKFMFGSTIIMLFEPGLVAHMVKDAPANVKMGEILGTLAKS